VKLLIFEFICGGGLAAAPLPSSLLREGRTMLAALLAELADCADVELIVPLDTRVQNLSPPPSARIVWIDGSRDYADWLPELLQQADLFWPVAPEHQQILQNLVYWAEQRLIPVLASSSQAIALCADKWQTYQVLSDAGLPCVPTALLSESVLVSWSHSVIKPRDGVGCLQSWVGAEPLVAAQRFQPAEQYIRQPYCVGQAMSWSALFRHGRAWLLCCNRQQIHIENHGFNLRGCEVNVADQDTMLYQQLLHRIARAMPGLWGYIGIDFIQTEQGPALLELNPRLTTSYAAIRAATGINVAELVLQLTQQSPQIVARHAQVVTISLES
jgi:tyramine---L-glutamate ligase